MERKWKARVPSEMSLPWQEGFSKTEETTHLRLVECYHKNNKRYIDCQWLWCASEFSIYIVNLLKSKSSQFVRVSLDNLIFEETGRGMHKIMVYPTQAQAQRKRITQPCTLWAKADTVRALYAAILKHALCGGNEIEGVQRLPYPAYPIQKMFIPTSFLESCMKENFRGSVSFSGPRSIEYQSDSLPTLPIPTPLCARTTKTKQGPMIPILEHKTSVLYLCSLDPLDFAVVHISPTLTPLFAMYGPRPTYTYTGNYLKTNIPIQSPTVSKGSIKIYGRETKIKSIGYKKQTLPSGYRILFAMECSHNESEKTMMEWWWASNHPFSVCVVPVTITTLEQERKVNYELELNIGRQKTREKKDITFTEKTYEFERHVGQQRMYGVKDMTFTEEKGEDTLLGRVTIGEERDTYTAEKESVRRLYNSILAIMLGTPLNELEGDTAPYVSPLIIEGSIQEFTEQLLMGQSDEEEGSLQPMHKTGAGTQVLYGHVGAKGKEAKVMACKVNEELFSRVRTPIEEQGRQGMLPERPVEERYLFGVRVGDILGNPDEYGDIKYSQEHRRDNVRWHPIQWEELNENIKIKPSDNTRKDKTSRFRVQINRNTIWRYTEMISEAEYWYETETPMTFSHTPLTWYWCSSLNAVLITKHRKDEENKPRKSYILVDLDKLIFEDINTQYHKIMVYPTQKQIATQPCTLWAEADTVRELYTELLKHALCGGHLPRGARHAPYPIYSEKTPFPMPLGFYEDEDKQTEIPDDQADEDDMIYKLKLAQLQSSIQPAAIPAMVRNNLVMYMLHNPVKEQVKFWGTYIPKKLGDSLLEPIRARGDKPKGNNIDTDIADELQSNVLGGGSEFKYSRLQPNTPPRPQRLQELQLLNNLIYTIWLHDSNGRQRRQVQWWWTSMRHPAVYIVEYSHEHSTSKEVYAAPAYVQDLKFNIRDGAKTGTIRVGGGEKYKKTDNPTRTLYRGILRHVLGLGDGDKLPEDVPCVPSILTLQDRPEFISGGDVQHQPGTSPVPVLKCNKDTVLYAYGDFKLYLYKIHTELYPYVKDSKDAFQQASEQDSGRDAKTETAVGNDTSKLSSRTRAGCYEDCNTRFQSISQMEDVQARTECRKVCAAMTETDNQELHISRIQALDATAGPEQ